MSVTPLFIYLLVCQHVAALKWGQVAVEQGSAGSVVLAENCTVDVMEAIARHQSVSTGGTAETLQGGAQWNYGSGMKVELITKAG